MRNKILTFGRNTYKIQIPQTPKDVPFSKFVQLTKCKNNTDAISLLTGVPSTLWDEEGAEELYDFLLGQTKWIFDFNPKNNPLPELFCVDGKYISTDFNILKERCIKYEATKLVISKNPDNLFTIPTVIAIYIQTYFDDTDNFDEESALELSKYVEEVRFDHVLSLGNFFFRKFKKSRNGTKRIVQTVKNLLTGKRVVSWI
jgi:hypothetical protein